MTRLADLLARGFTPNRDPVIGPSVQPIRVQSILNVSPFNTHDSVIERGRPLLEKLSARSNVEWGEPPRYTAEYRKIRWPKNEDPGKPLWMSNMHYELRRKARGLWNSAGRRQFKKVDTSSSLRRDLLFCVRENIPFKTKTLEYKPFDQWVYVLGDKLIRYNLEIGAFDAFTYSGRYHKLKAFMLRKFGIHVRHINNKLCYLREDMFNIEINLHTLYELQYRRNGNLIINNMLFFEYEDYKRSQDLQNRDRDGGE